LIEFAPPRQLNRSVASLETALENDPKGAERGAALNCYVRDKSGNPHFGYGFDVSSRNLANA
jgi:hypothetical protein